MSHSSATETGGQEQASGSAISRRPTRPPLRFYGGKMRLAPWITSFMPEHRVYLEPFAGSLAVLLAKPRARFEFVNDLDDLVVNFWRVLRDKPEDLERACALTPYARSEHQAADPTEPGLDDVERARRWWTRVEQAFNGTPKVTAGWSASIGRGSAEVTSSLERLSRFGPVAARLRGVTIECDPAVDVIRRLGDAPDAVIYADPPYVRSARRDGGAGYRCEMTDEEHGDLAAVLHETPGCVLLSGYHSPLYDELYADWHRVERRVVRRMARMNGGVGTATEVLWSNRPLRADNRLFGWDGEPLMRVATSSGRTR